MSSVVNQEYFDNVNKSIEGCKSCKELQEVIDKQSPAINDLQNSINSELAKIAPMLELVNSPAANPTAIVTWLATLYGGFITPRLQSYYTNIEQLTLLSAKVENMKSTISNVSSKIPNCNANCSIVIEPYVEGRHVANITISSNKVNIDLLTDILTGNYIAGRSDITITIDAGVIIGSASIDVSALTIQGFSSGDTVTINNNGYIVGKGGDGEGWYGGDAITVSFNTTFINNGVIGGGGGGGGMSYGWDVINAGGGGGAGYGYGAGASGIYYGIPIISSGTYSTLTVPGVGGIKEEPYAKWEGGNGGTLGSNGGDGGVWFGGTCYLVQAGGVAGKAVVGNSYCTWSTLGTIYGSRI